MHYCEQCGRSVEPVEPNRSPQTCPHCDSPLKPEPQGAWTNVARLTNLAEAGFLTDELTSEGVEARVYAVESFSILTDTWIPSYLIQVPSDSAHEAATMLRHRLAGEQVADQALADTYDYDRSPADSLAWRPVVLVLAAGAICFVLGQHFARQEIPRRPLPPNSLPATIDAIGRPLFTEPIPGQPRHRLSYQWREQAWYLDTDVDGDGTFESHRKFHATGAGQ